MYQRMAFTVLVFWTCCWVFAALVPPESGSAVKLYFPTTVGSKWVYDYNGKEETEEITAVEKKDTSFVVTVKGTNYLKGTINKQFVVSTENLVQTKSNIGTGQPPMILLKLPGKAGQTWETYLGGHPGMGKNTVKACGAEIIEVPTGKFEAIRVETKFFSPGGWTEARYWYAPGVGLVKETYGDNVRKLKSFTPGKK